MHARPLVAIVILSTLAATSLPAGAGASPAGDVIVAFRALPAERGHYGGDPVVASDEALRFLVVRGNPEAIERRAARDGAVVAFERDLEDMHAFLTPTDPLYAGYQYDLEPATTDIEAAFDVTLGDPAVMVCVVDTGQYRAHQDFAGVAWGPWRDFVSGKTSAYDDNGHGTHVTGTIAAQLDNGKGIAGMAPDATIAGAKVLNRQGSGTYSAVASGISWCADQGADVINLSLGGGYSSTVASAVSYATAQGALVVAAAGNSGPCSNCVGYPARQAEAFAVACTNASNALCSFSSQGPEVDIAAPGQSIASTYPAGKAPCGRKDANCYVLLSGTSMSTPHVAGLAALVKSAHPALSMQDVRARIQATAVDLGAAGPDAQLGAGIIRGQAVH